jgi:hypothetical protein
VETSGVGTVATLSVGTLVFVLISAGSPYGDDDRMNALKVKAAVSVPQLEEAICEPQVAAEVKVYEAEKVKEFADGRKASVVPVPHAKYTVPGVKIVQPVQLDPATNVNDVPGAMPRFATPPIVKTAGFAIVAIVTVKDRVLNAFNM